LNAALSAREAGYSVIIMDKAAIERFEQVGCNLRRPGGTFFRPQSYGQPGPWWIKFSGKRLKPLLAAAARRAGCRVLDRVVTGDLLLNDGHVCGAAGENPLNVVNGVLQARGACTPAPGL
jgi:hypothetical protein